MTTESHPHTPVEAPGSGTWAIDPGHSSVTVTARHLMVSKVRGSLSGVEGTVHVGERPEASSDEVTIDAPSDNTHNPPRDEHMRPADFLDLQNFPKIRLCSTKTQVT